MQPVDGSAVLLNLESQVLVVGEDGHGKREPHAIAARQTNGLPNFQPSLSSASRPVKSAGGARSEPPAVFLVLLERRLGRRP